MKIITIANRKGGTAKTTTAINLAAGLAQLKNNVLLIDTDSQANATTLYLKRGDFQASLYHALVAAGVIEMEKCIYHVRKHLWLIPAERKLFQAQRLIAASDQLNILSSIISEINKFDYVIIDTPPSEEALFHNAIYAATDVIVPVKTGYMDYIGTEEMLNIVGKLQARVSGLLPTFYDARRRIDRGIVTALETHFPKLVLEPIRENTALSLASAKRQSIFEYDAGAIGAKDYLALVARYA